jgi:hypothetical protein
MSTTRTRTLLVSAFAWLLAAPALVTGVALTNVGGVYLFVEVMTETGDIHDDAFVLDGSTTGGLADATVTISNLDAFVTAEPTSSEDRLTISAADVTDGVLTIAAGATVTVTANPRHRRQTTATVKKTLVVRITGSNGATGAISGTQSAAELSDSIFGTTGDAVNLRSQ